jgi:hypothetical protein
MCRIGEEKVRIREAGEQAEIERSVQLRIRESHEIKAKLIKTLTSIDLCFFLFLMIHLYPNPCSVRIYVKNNLDSLQWNYHHSKFERTLSQDLLFQALSMNQCQPQKVRNAERHSHRNI